MTPRQMLSLAGALVLMTLALTLYWRGRSAGIAAERPKAVAAQERAKVAQLETDGARITAAQADQAYQRREAAHAVVARIIQQSQTSESAHAPLDHDRADRLGRADRELCELAHDLIGCAAPP